MKKILTSLLLIGLLATVVGIGVSANYTRTTTASGDVAMGTITLSNSTYEWSSNIGNMKPGDTATFDVDVKNDGSLPCQLSAATPTISLSGQLDPRSEFTITLNYWVNGNWVGWDGEGNSNTQIAAQGGHGYVRFIITMNSNGDDYDNYFQGATGTVSCVLTGSQIQ